MKTCSIKKLLLIALAFVGSQLGFFRGVDLILHQVTEHQSKEHGHDDEHVHPHGDSHHHGEEATSEKPADHDATAHDHSDEINFYNSLSQFVNQIDVAVVFLKAVPNQSGHFLLSPVTYDYKDRISRPPCVA